MAPSFGKMTPQAAGTPPLRHQTSGSQLGFEGRRQAGFAGTASHGESMVLRGRVELRCNFRHWRLSMYKRASDAAQQRARGRGPLSGAGLPTYPMTGPKPGKWRAARRAAKRAAAQEAERKKREEEKKRQAELKKRIEEARERERKLRRVKELRKKIR